MPGAIAILLLILAISSLCGWWLSSRKTAERPLKIMMFIGYFWLVTFVQILLFAALYFVEQRIFLIDHMTLLPDLIGYLAAALTTASFLPQAVLTLKTRNTDSLSLGMYSLFTSGVFMWLIYGVYLSNPAIIVANAITFLLAALILGFKIYNTFFKRLTK